MIPFTSLMAPQRITANQSSFRKILHSSHLRRAFCELSLSPLEPHAIHDEAYNASKEERS
jgi:hypothetical protein